MKVIIAKNYEELSQFAGYFVARQVQANPEIVLGLSTGKTMVGFYADLVKSYNAGKISFSSVVTFNVDEYIGVPADHQSSFRSFMNRHLFSHIDIRRENIHIPDGNAEDLLGEAQGYEDKIKIHNGIDLMILGLGKNGHIAYNEPGSSLGSRTRVKKLNKETIDIISQDFDNPNQVPKYVITIGIGTILEAREILVLVSGKGKEIAVKNMIEGPITSQCPASVLQLHPHVFVVVEQEVGILLKGEYETVSQVMSDPFEEFFWEGG